MTLRAVGGGISQAVADGRYQALGTVKNVSPTTGQTAAFDNASADQVLYITPAGALAALTISLPSDASSRLGQRAVFACSQAVTALTVNGSTNIANPPANLNANDCFAFIKVAANTWVLLQ